VLQPRRRTRNKADTTLNDEIQPPGIRNLRSHKRCDPVHERFRSIYGTERLSLQLVERRMEPIYMPRSRRDMLRIQQLRNMLVCLRPRRAHLPGSTFNIRHRMEELGPDQLHKKRILRRTDIFHGPAQRRIGIQDRLRPIQDMGQERHNIQRPKHSEQTIPADRLFALHNDDNNGSDNNDQADNYDNNHDHNYYQSNNHIDHNNHHQRDNHIDHVNHLDDILQRLLRRNNLRRKEHKRPDMRLLRTVHRL
jgi:hypothetical protein